MRFQLKQLRIDGHRHSNTEIADFAEKILSEGYSQDPPFVVSDTHHSRRRIVDGTLRFLALQYIAKYTDHKVIKDGIECQILQSSCGVKP